MDPDRKRKIRLVVALGLAVVLAARRSSTRRSRRRPRRRSPPSSSGASGGSYELTGKVADGSRRARRAPSCEFEVADRDDPSATSRSTTAGQVPDPFREGREVIVTGSSATAPSSPRRTA